VVIIQLRTHKKRNIFFRLVMLVVLTVYFFSVQAERHALIVGVWQYENPKYKSLKLLGPEKDTLSILGLVKDAGFKSENIIILANPISKLEWIPRNGIQIPTRKSIVRAMLEIELKSKPGDQVFMYFSGYGSQQPIQQDPEVKHTEFKQPEVKNLESKDPKNLSKNLPANQQKIVTSKAKSPKFFRHKHETEFDSHARFESMTNTGIEKKPAEQNEVDELDEIFLPTDIGRWNSKTKKVDNAILDNEFKEIFNRIRKKGVFVWAVFDVGFNSVSEKAADGSTIRYLAPERLGIPKLEIALKGIRSDGVEEPIEVTKYIKSATYKGKKQKAGGIVLFSAEQAIQGAVEKQFESNGDSIITDKKRATVVQGVLTYNLVDLIRQNPKISYQELVDKIKHRYTLQSVVEKQLPVPGISCPKPGCDLPILFAKSDKKKLSMELVKAGELLKLNAGVIQGLSVGTILAVVENPDDPTKKIISYVRIIDTSQLSSHVESIDWAGKKAKDLSKIKSNLFVRLASTNVRMKLRVALPKKHVKTSAVYNRVLAIIKKIEKEKHLTTLIEWVKSGAEADLRLSLYTQNEQNRWRLAKKLWLLPHTGQIIRSGNFNSYSIPLTLDDIKLQQQLVTHITNIAKLRNLMGLGAHYTERVKGLKVTVTLKRSESNKEEVVPLSKIQNLRDKDSLWVEIENRTAKSFDIGVFTVNDKLEFERVFPKKTGSGVESNIIKAGFKNKKLVSPPSSKTTGIKRLIIVAAENNGNNESFKFLAQTNPKATLNLSQARQNIISLLYQARYGAGKTGNVGIKHASDRKGLIKVFTFQTE